ncbi:hypothetical protein DFP72DRAFT_1103716 [Ephemerocybe angulata]|uniref:Uncharacterized protein n=1 Tax=Ephemerocybe angulata TaxID=980116 RepID=A0A8H6I6I1_9AGAR|nr:hypothetical protein DFP72DRAFT_1103716 [Tulosesus angulatus]
MARPALSPNRCKLALAQAVPPATQDRLDVHKYARVPRPLIGCPFPQIHPPPALSRRSSAKPTIPSASHRIGQEIASLHRALPSSIALSLKLSRSQTMASLHQDQPWAQNITSHLPRLTTTKKARTIRASSRLHPCSWAPRPDDYNSFPKTSAMRTSPPKTETDNSSSPRRLDKIHARYPGTSQAAHDRARIGQAAAFANAGRDAEYASPRFLDPKASETSQSQAAHGPAHNITRAASRMLNETLHLSRYRTFLPASPEQAEPAGLRVIATLPSDGESPYSRRERAPSRAFRSSPIHAATATTTLGSKRTMQARHHANYAPKRKGTGWDQ